MQDGCSGQQLAECFTGRLILLDDLYMDAQLKKLGGEIKCNPTAADDEDRSDTLLVDPDLLEKGTEILVRGGYIDMESPE